MDWSLGIGRWDDVGGWRLEVKGKKGWSTMDNPVRRALGQSRFVGVGQSRWRYVVLWLKTNNIVSLVLGRRS